MTVLVIGLPNDPVVAPVLRALSRRHASVVMWNTRDLLNDVEVLDAGGASGLALIGDRAVPLADIHGVFTRQSNVELTPEFRALPPDDPLALHAVAAAHRLSEWTDSATCRVMNRPSANESNSAKAFQAQLIRRHFFVPETLITNDPEAARAFAERHRRAIYKSCSGERSIVTELSPGEIERKADAIAACPVQFQEYVAGADVRVHVVGDAVFATEITAEGTDYRYDARARWRKTSVSPEIGDAAIALTADLGLELAGIDLRIAPDGRVVCFEVNPSPAFSVYEQATGQDIASVVAAHLCAAA